MKKVFVILLAVCFLAGMTACGGSAPAPAPEPQVEETILPCDEEVSGDEEAAEDVQEQE